MSLLSSKLSPPESSTSPSTPPGFNQGLREVSRLLLGISALALFYNSNGLATISSALAIMVLRDGTFFSVKNIKWTSLSIISFLLSLISYSLGNTAEWVQQVSENDSTAEKTISIIFLCQMKFLQMFWGCVLTFVLVQAYTTKAKEHDTKINHFTPAKIM